MILSALGIILTLIGFIKSKQPKTTGLYAIMLVISSVLFFGLAK